MKLNELTKCILSYQKMAVLNFRSFTEYRYSEWLDQMFELTVDCIETVDNTLVIYVH